MYVTMIRLYLRTNTQEITVIARNKDYFKVHPTCGNTVFVWCLRHSTSKLNIHIRYLRKSELSIKVILYVYLYSIYTVFM